MYFLPWSTNKTMPDISMHIIQPIKYDALAVLKQFPLGKKEQRV